MINQKICILILLLFIACQPANGQVFSWGVKGGIISGTPYGKAPDGATGSLGTGPKFGVFVRYNLNDKWSLQSEMTYGIKGGKFRSPVSGDTLWEQIIQTPFDTFSVTIPTKYNGWADGEFNNIYIDLPIILLRKLNESFSVYSGIQISYLMKGGNSGTADLEIGDAFDYVENEPFDESDQIKNWDFGWLLGVNLETTKAWNCSLNFAYGLTSIYKETYTLLDQEVKNMYLSLTIGYRFGAKRFGK